MGGEREMLGSRRALSKNEDWLEDEMDVQTYLPFDTVFEAFDNDFFIRAQKNIFWISSYGLLPHMLGPKLLSENFVDVLSFTSPVLLPSV